MFCENCGANIPDSAKFCEKCGAAVGTDTEIKKRRIWPVVIIVISLLVIAAAGAVVAFQFIGRNNSDTEKTMDVSDYKEKSAEEEEPAKDEEDAEKPEKTDEDETDDYENHDSPLFTTVSASDTLIEDGYDHSADLAADGYSDTAWAVGGGVGEWIMLSARSDQYVSGIKILNGYNKYNSNTGNWLYYVNNRPRVITVSFSDGSSFTKELKDVFSETEDLYQDIPLNQTVKTNYVKITVESVYFGSEWDDTCISEIQVY